ncbi:MAG: ATP-binding protein [Bacteroidetes bacterium]|nr:ATP-binding protein [Bacteroidota bacterium]
MKLNEYFDSIDINEIERFIIEKQEENVSIEFKTVNHPDYNDSNREYDKINISETISGFANSNGGIVIWGIKAQKDASGQDVAKDKRPIKQLTKFLNLLNRLEGQAVTPTITGIIHKKIEVAKDEGYIKTFVPQSENAPHMANFSGKHYYKRSGDSFYQCEHYDIIDMISRKKSPKLRVVAKVVAKQILHQTTTRWRILVSVINDGNNIAKYPYLALTLSSGWQADEYGLDGNRNTGLAKVRNNVLFQHNYSGGVDKVIYPGAMLDVDHFCLDIAKELPPPNLTISYTTTAEDSENIKGKIEIDSSEFAKS